MIAKFHAFQILVIRHKSEKTPKNKIKKYFSYINFKHYFDNTYRFVWGFFVSPWQGFGFSNTTFKPSKCLTRMYRMPSTSLSGRNPYPHAPDQKRLTDGRADRSIAVTRVCPLHIRLLNTCWNTLHYDKLCVHHTHTHTFLRTAGGKAIRH